VARPVAPAALRAAARAARPARRRQRTGPCHRQAGPCHPAAGPRFPEGRHLIGRRQWLIWHVVRRWQRVVRRNVWRR
jgi:hypothetical protein